MSILPKRVYCAWDVRCCDYLLEAPTFRKSHRLLDQSQGVNTVTGWFYPPPLSLNTHSTRARATSGQNRHRRIFSRSAAMWSTPSTFYKHYKLDVNRNPDLSICHCPSLSKAPKLFLLVMPLWKERWKLHQDFPITWPGVLPTLCSI